MRMKTSLQILILLACSTSRQTRQTRSVRYDQNQHFPSSHEKYKGEHDHGRLAHEGWVEVAQGDLVARMKACPHQVVHYNGQTGLERCEFT